MTRFSSARFGQYRSTETRERQSDMSSEVSASAQMATDVSLEQPCTSILESPWTGIFIVVSTCRPKLGAWAASSPWPAE